VDDFNHGKAWRAESAARKNVQSQTLDLRKVDGPRSIVIQVDPSDNVDLLGMLFQPIQETYGDRVALYFSDGTSIWPVPAEPLAINAMDSSQHRGRWSID
jgi:hypothetical protein